MHIKDAKKSHVAGTWGEEVPAGSGEVDWTAFFSVLKEIHCPDSADQPCRLSGSNLFLIDSVASDQQFAHNAPVPTDFIDSTLNVPHPGDGGLFIKLRDDPSSVNTVTLPVATDPKAVGPEPTTEPEQPAQPAPQSDPPTQPQH